jgi:predicted nucleic acid-binding protein
MLGIKIFLDSSALMAGIISNSGASRALLLLGEDEKLLLFVSEQVIVEIERNIARKIPEALPFAREMIRHAKIQIVRDPSKEEVISHLDWISHQADVPVLIAAVRAKAGFLATLNVKHFIDDPDVARMSGMLIGTPGDALLWVRKQLTKNGE